MTTMISPHAQRRHTAAANGIKLKRTEKITDSPKKKDGQYTKNMKVNHGASLPGSLGVCDARKCARNVKQF